MARSMQQATFDENAIDDMIMDLVRADEIVRKSIVLPEGMENPARVIATLCALSKHAASAAAALAICMASQRDRELLEARLRAEAESAQ